MRESRFVDNSTSDDEDIVEAGSDLEYDMLRDWGRDELVEKIQELDNKLWETEESHKTQLKLLADIRSAELTLSQAQVESLQGRVKELEDKLRGF